MSQTGLIFSRERCLIRWRTSHSVRWSYSPTQRNEFLIVLLTNLCPMKVFGPQSSLLSNSAEGECWMCQIRSESPLVLTKLRCPLNQLPLALPSIANLTNLSKVSTWHLLKTWKNWSFYSSQVPFRILRQVTCAKEVELSSPGPNPGPNRLPSRIKRKKEGFGPWADSKITWATHPPPPHPPHP